MPYFATTKDYFNTSELHFEATSDFFKVYGSECDYYHYLSPLNINFNATELGGSFDDVDGYLFTMFEELGGGCDDVDLECFIDYPY